MATEMIAIASAIIAFLFAYLAVKIEKEHPALQFFFLIMSIMTIIFTFILMASLADAADQTGIKELMEGMYEVNIIVMIFIVLYFMLTIIKEVLMSFMKK